MAEPRTMCTPAFEARRLVRAAGRAPPWPPRPTASPSPAWSPRPPRPTFRRCCWLSSLSEHTRQLRAEPRCALLFAGAPDGPIRRPRRG